MALNDFYRPPMGIIVRGLMFLLLSVGCQHSFGADEVYLGMESSAPPEQIVPGYLYEETLKSAIGADPSKDTQQLRANVSEELINRELLAQEAIKRNLDKSPKSKALLEQARLNVLIELLTADLGDKAPISESDLKHEYDRQVELLSKGDSQYQYKVSLIALSNEDSAQAALVKLKKGESFESVARQLSIDPSRDSGGQAGWLLPSQVAPVIANVMVNLQKGSYSVAPIKMTDQLWQIIRVEDKRKFKIPRFEESYENLKIAIIQARRLELLKQLRQGTKL